MFCSNRDVCVGFVRENVIASAATNDKSNENECLECFGFVTTESADRRPVDDYWKSRRKSSAIGFLFSEINELLVV